MCDLLEKISPDPLISWSSDLLLKNLFGTPQRPNSNIPKLDLTRSCRAACLQPERTFAKLFVAHIGDRFAVHLHDEVRSVGDDIEAAPHAGALDAPRQRRIHTNDA